MEDVNRPQGSADKRKRCNKKELICFTTTQKRGPTKNKTGLLHVACIVPPNIFSDASFPPPYDLVVERETNSELGHEPYLPLPSVKSALKTLPLFAP